MVENDQREALTDSDRAAAFQQLAFEGLSVTAIARRTGTKQKEVKTALAVVETRLRRPRSRSTSSPWTRRRC